VPKVSARSGSESLLWLILYQSFLSQGEPMPERLR